MDNLDTIIEVIFVIIFLFGRFILRLITGGGKKDKAAQQKAAPERESLSPAEPAPSMKAAPAKAPTSAPLSTPAPQRPGIAKRVKKKEAPSLNRMSDTIQAALEVQKERAKSIESTCNYRNFLVLKQDLQRYVEQIRGFIAELETARDQKALNRTMLNNFTDAVNVIDDRLSVFDAAIKERTTSHSAHFNGADLILTDLVATCRQRHRDGESLYQYLFGGVLLDQKLVKGGLFGAEVSQAHVANPREWPHIAASLHYAFAQRGRYGTQMAGELGLPQAVNSISYFLTTGRLMSAGLISSWMDWIYADVAATLQMGEAYAEALAAKCEKTGDGNELAGLAIDRRGRVSGMPLISRLVTVHAALQSIGVFDMEAFNARVAKIVTQHPNLSVDIQGRGQVPLQASAINSDLFKVAASVVNTPFSVLHGYTVEEIAGTDFGRGQTTYLQTLAESLRKGKPDYSVRPSRLVIAIHMAIKAERNAERRVESAALQSLQKQEKAKAPQLQHTAEWKAPASLEDVFSPAFLPQTVMIGTLSKTRGGISRASQ